jgi:hypothetical protein
MPRTQQLKQLQNNLLRNKEGAWNNHKCLTCSNKTDKI